MNTEEEKLNKELINVSGSGDLIKMQSLIKKGADIHTEDNALLTIAAYHGYLDIVKYLVENGLDVHTGKEIPLLNSTSGGHLEVVKYLMEQGAGNPEKNNVLLKSASKHRYLHLVKYFIVECGYDPKIALKEATNWGHNEIIDFCKSYIESKQLNDKLENDLDKNNAKTNSMKVKV